MPLIVITGVPCSGKTTRTDELMQHFQSEGKDVFVVSEGEYLAKRGLGKNACYSDPSKEKEVRAHLKSEVCRLLRPSNVVILDALNYIKGYRYELYCASKAQKSTQCTVHAEINRDEAWKWNESRGETERYARDVFDALVVRYECPDRKNRWDSPLFMVFPGQELDKAGVASCLFNKEPPPPNMSTQNPPLSSTNFLYDLDQTTKKIVDDLIKALNVGSAGVVPISGSDLSIDLSNATVRRLMLLRRQYITYSKLHPPDASQIQQLFVHYLTANLP